MAKNVLKDVKIVRSVTLRRVAASVTSGSMVIVAKAVRRCLGGMILPIRRISFLLI